jgi:hypothetical protein
MFQEHLKSCGYCQNIDRATKLAELGHMIKGTKAASSVTTTKSYPNTNTNAKESKVKRTWENNKRGVAKEGKAI